MTRVESLILGVALLALLVALALAEDADTQELLVPPIVDVEQPPPSDPSLRPEWTAATAGGWALRLPLGGIVNVVDLQCGTVARDPNTGAIRKQKLNCNIGAGDHVHRGYVVLSPDVGKGTIMEGGHTDKLALIRSERYGGSEFRVRVRFEKGLTVCDRRGCVDLMRALRRRR